MIHLPAEHVLNEMMSLQQLTRACISNAGGGRNEPTLVVKAKSLSLKYILKAARIRLVAGRTRADKCFYGVVINDDPSSPYTLWSFVERDDEMEALQRILSGEQFMLALFNEAVVNICSGLLRLQAHGAEAVTALEHAKVGAVGEGDEAESEVIQLLEDWQAGGASVAEFTSDGAPNWGPNTCIYVTNQLQTAQLNLTNADEGCQQEQLAAWITDSLHPRGVFQNPTVCEKVPRELCDLLLTHEFGTILFESKALTILSRQDVPTRDKLRTDIVKHVRKALRQLSGACRNISSGKAIIDRSGGRVEVQRKLPQHCVVIVPDQSLLGGAERIVLKDMANFAIRTRAFVNVLDPSQLFSLMMDSNNLSHRQQATTPLMAFDYLLIRRSDSVLKSRDPGVVTLCRFHPSTDADIAEHP
jgi:hypothetical protein